MFNLKNYLAITAVFVFTLSGAYRPKKEIVTAIPLEEQAQLSPFFDCRPEGTRFSYLYSPGFQTTEVAMGRLCPQFTAVTGEKITWRSGCHVVGQPHSAVVYSEIDLRKPTYFTLNPIEYLVNSIRRDMAPLAQRFMQHMLDFTVEDNPESKLSVVNYSFNFSKANLGQEADIKALYKQYNRHIQKFPDTSVVLYGDSRGAATIFNFIALHKPAEVKAAVLEGIFDSLPHVVKHVLFSDKTETEEERLYSLAKFTLGSYKEDGICPRECAELIGDAIPLLFVISLKDGLVSPQCAFYLYNRLHERGHKNIHILVLKKALHPAYMVSDIEDKNTYEAVVHAFYKHYNAPYNTEKAALGKRAFEATQPTPAELQATYKLDQCALCDATKPHIVARDKRN